MSIPEKPVGWKKPNRKYGGYTPSTRAGPVGGPDDSNDLQPDLSIICNAVVSRVRTRKERIQTPGYCMKVQLSCPLSCCQYLQPPEEEEEEQQQIIVRKTIHRRRPKSQQAAPQQPQSAVALSAGPPQPDPQQAAEAEATKQRQHAEAVRKYEQQQQQQEEEMARQQHLEEQKRQQAAEAAETERQAIAASAAEAEQQAVVSEAAEAAAATPAAPVQKVATFQNTGTDPTMAAAELYYESTRWGPLGHGDPAVSVGSFPGHRWFIVANGTYAKLFTIGEEAQQTFTI